MIHYLSLRDPRLGLCDVVDCLERKGGGGREDLPETFIAL